MLSQTVKLFASSLMLLPVVCPDLLITSQGRNAPNSLTRSRKTLLVFIRQATTRYISSFAFIFVVSF
nr:MAG TPA: hypothetical protein [Caudoviricetes sp.]